MGRKKIDEKKITITVCIPTRLYEQLEDIGIKNKSKLFNWLLEQHFGIVEDEKEGGTK